MICSINHFNDFRTSNAVNQILCTYDRLLWLLQLLIPKVLICFLIVRQMYMYHYFGFNINASLFHNY